MTLDDRSLREHLDRRAEAGASDVEGIADVVMARVAVTGRGGWWRGLSVRGPSLGAAATAIMVVVVALAVVSPGIWPGPGTSTPSETAPAPDYPGLRALTVKELDAVLGSDPAARAGEIVIASVTLEAFDLRCYGTDCPRYLANLDGRIVSIHDPGEAAPELPGASVLRIRSDGDLDLLGHVRAGPDGLAWTLPQLTAELPEIRTADRAVPYLYLVDAVHVVTDQAYRCRFGMGEGEPDFDCGTGVAWLVPNDASLPSSFTSAPTGSLRVPNVSDVRYRMYALQQHGYWLVDPFVAQDEATCFLCPPVGAVDLIGRVPTGDELELMPPEATAPPVGDYPTDRALTAAEAAEVVAGFTGDGRYLAVVIEADMVPIDRFPECLGDYACPTWEIRVVGSEPIPVWATAGFVPNPDGPDAFTIVSDSGGSYEHGLSYVGPVMAGPDGFVWTLPQLLSDLPSLRTDGDFPYVYMVEAERVSTPNPAPCPSIAPEPEPTFDCRTDLAWLVPEGTSVIDEVTRPEAGIRVPGATYMLDSLERRQSGHWLIDPVPTPSVCIACPPGGAAAMIGRLPSLAELGLTP
ncbi:MAG: hypothetical protein AB1736_13570 [Chloroflexota bacterium]